MANDERLQRFGDRLRELRKARGLNTKQLADKSGLSERAIIKWERGEREPGWFKVLDLCSALGVNCTAFHAAAAPETTDTRQAKGEPPAVEGGKVKAKKGKSRKRKG